MQTASSTLNQTNYQRSNVLRNNRFKDLTNKKFGRLTAIDYFFDFSEKGLQITYWNCVCDCGNQKSVRATHLSSGMTKSCGCIKKEGLRKRHSMTGTRFFGIWQNMKSRCLNENTPSFSDYGGRGIQICEKWKRFEGFKEDMFESYQKHILKFGKSDTSIDRIDNDDGYYLENCRWATKREQNLNTRKNKKYLINNELLTLTEIAEKYNVPRETVFYRLKKWDLSRVERSLINNETHS